MEIDNLKIDQDLESYLSSKEDPQVFINECIRAAKENDEKFRQEEKEKQMAVQKEAAIQAATKEEMPSGMKYLVIFFSIVFVALAFAIIKSCNGEKTSHEIANNEQTVAIDVL